MSAAIDILQGADGDLPIEQNDFTIAFSDEQHITDCLNSLPGWWKQNPANGVGLGLYLKSRAQPAKVLQNVKKQLQNDGYVLINPKVLNINGEMQLILSSKETGSSIYRA